MLDGAVVGATLGASEGAAVGAAVGETVHTEHAPVLHPHPALQAQYTVPKMSFEHSPFASSQNVLCSEAVHTMS